MKKTAWALIFATMLMVAALVLAGCGGSSSGGGGGNTLEVTLQDYKFTPNQMSVNKGQVTLKLTNKASQPHDFSVPELKINVLVEPGKSVSQTISLDKPGTYQVICNQPGHKDSGMVAQLTVK